LPLAASPAPAPADGADAATIATILQQLANLRTSGPGTTVERTVALPSPPVSAPPAVAAAAGAGIQREAAAPPPPPAAAPADDHSSLFAERPDDADLNRLARWLYPIISYQLRAELREGRERSGLLTESYRRW
jgi:hypothetical protein